MRKKIIAFDLDGTLTKSKSRVDADIVFWIRRLLKKYKVAIITGGTFAQIQNQFISELGNMTLEDKEQLRYLYLLPTSGASLYEHESYFWKKVYNKDISPEEAAIIYTAFYKAIAATNTYFPEIYGNHIENRITQITFSALGQKAPIELKKEWDPDFSKRQKIISEMKNDPLVAQFEIRFGGTTSIDVTHKGIDKSFGISKLMEYLSVNKEDILFIGDALQKGGNDFPVKEMGIECISVSGPQDTLKIIKKLYMSS